MHRRRKPLILILDSLPAHKGKAVRNYVESTNGKLELHFLPGYAPELNPDELVWNHMKRTGTARSPMAKGESLHQRIDEELFQIKWNPALVRSFFKAKDVSYISDRLVMEACVSPHLGGRGCPWWLTREPRSVDGGAWGGGREV